MTNAPNEDRSTTGARRENASSGDTNIEALRQYISEPFHDAPFATVDPLDTLLRKPWETEAMSPEPATQQATNASDLNTNGGVATEAMFPEPATQQQITASGSGTINNMEQDFDFSDKPLEQYRSYIIDRLPLTGQQKTQVRAMLDDRYWPWVWRSLVSIKGCKWGIKWTWDEGGEGDNHDAMLRVLREEFGLPWEDLAGYIFIGMRPSQCKSRYAEVKGRG